MRLAFRRPAVWAPITGVVVLGAVLGPSLRVADLEDALVRDANAIVAAPRPRPVHVDVARPGTFADALREPLPRYERSWEELVGADARTLASKVAKGECPPSDLPREVASGLSSIEADLEAVLGASRAERADLGPDHDPFGPFAGTSWLGLMDAARHAAIRIRTTGFTSPARALSDCLDGLALGRDAAVSGGLVGRMVRASIVSLLTPACAEAVSASTTADARAAGRGLRRIREAAPSFGAMLSEEGIQVQLLAFGPRLPPEAKDRLLPRPRAFAEHGSMALSGVLGPVRSRLAWRELRRLQDRLSAIGTLPAPERDAAFAAMGPSSFALRFLFGNLDGPEPVESYARYSRQDAAAELQLDLLVALSGRASSASDGPGGRPRSRSSRRKDSCLPTRRAGSLACSSTRSGREATSGSCCPCRRRTRASSRRWSSGSRPATDPLRLRARRSARRPRPPRRGAVRAQAPRSRRWTRSASPSCHLCADERGP